MKIIPTYRPVALAVLLLLVAAGCRQHEISADMPDSLKLEALDINLERHPDDPELLSARAQVLFKMKRLKEASFDIGRALTLDPDNLDYLMLQADIYFADGNIEGSYRTLEKAETLAPENAEVQLKLGEITFYGRDYDRSLKYLSKVTEHDANNRTALFMKGFIYKEKGDTASAVQMLRRVCDRFPDYAPAFEELGILYAARNENMALEYLNTALQLEPTNTNAMYALAMFYQDRQDYENAETLYRQMLSVNEASADAWHNLGWIELFHYRDYENAIEYMTRAIESSPQYIEAYANRGCAYELSGDVAHARADFQTALSINAAYQPAVDGLNRLK